jgi:arylsulfatase A
MKLYRITGILGLLWTLLSSAQAAAAKPNVVLFMADDFGYEAVGANGGESYRTPQLDRLAATGMRFEQCHVQPLCTPTRLQLMTAIYNVRNYIEFGLIDPNATTFGHLMKRAGYATAVVGKWQLGQAKDLPQRLGFDESYLWQHTRKVPDLPPRFANPGIEYNGVPKDFNHGEYGPKVVNDFALDFITRQRDGRFFNLTEDWFEEKTPSAVRGLSGRDAAEARKLQAVLDRYANARPKHLAEHVASAGSKGAGGGKQATIQNKKQ